jgi:hypothetical protein
MLGQPTALLIPDVIGFRLSGRLPEGATATDLVLTITQMLRRRGEKEASAHRIEVAAGRSLHQDEWRPTLFMARRG